MVFEGRVPIIPDDLARAVDAVCSGAASDRVGQRIVERGVSAAAI